MAVTTLPAPAAYGNELLPLMRWLAAHLAPAASVVVSESRATAALASAMPKDGALMVIAPGDPVPMAGLVQVTATLTDATLCAARSSLLPGGLIVSGVSPLPGGLSLAIGDGVTLFAGGTPPPVFVWLEAITAADCAAVAGFLDGLGRQFAAAATLEGLAASDKAARLGQGKALKRAQLTTAAVQQECERLRADYARLESERDAIVRSSSWRMTWPVRRLLLAAKSRLARPAASVDDDAVDAKAAFRKQAAQTLWDFLVSADRLQMPQAAAPDVSIVLVLYNQAALTLLCLRSILATLPLGASAEVVIVDNASTDDTHLLLSRVEGATVLYNEANQHFLHGVNQALSAARGRDILLLNNDTQLRPGSIQAALQTLHSAPDIGAVGGKIILPDGTLQEAGSIVWSDGTCAGYGRGRDPNEAEFQFRRDVDFCSGAFLLVRGGLIRGLGGLDPAFAPAYYEEVDLCMRLQAAGHRVVYEPGVVLDHFEFASSASSADAFSLQRRNHAIFAERHAARLQAGHLPPGSPAMAARMRHGGRRLLYIDDRVPYPELGAGYPRAARILRDLVADGWFVTLYPAHDPVDDFADAYAAFPREIEFMLGHGYGQMAAFLRERDGLYDTIMVSRPHNMQGFLAARGGTHAGARVIYDAEAMFAQREFLRMAQAGRPVTPELRRAMLAEELALTQSAVTVTAVNEHEADIFRGGGHRDVRVLGLGVEPAPVPAAFSGRDGFLFVGLLDEDDSPNVDALVYFVGEVLPLLTGRLGRPAVLTVAGRCRSARAQALAGTQVRLMGLVEDLTPLYAAARVFVAPHRFAAGLPLKVQEAAGRGLPVVVSPLLAKQLGWTDGAELLVAADAPAFADACARLHGDAGLWHDLRRRALDRLRAEVAASAFTPTLRRIMAG